MRRLLRQPAGPAVEVSEILRVVWPQLVTVVVVLALSALCIWLLSAARAYVGSEGLSAKSQRDAVVQLLRYADTGDEEYFRAYEAAMRVPQGNMLARRELEKSSPDYDAVRAALIQARNYPADIAGMAAFFRWFHAHPGFDQAMARWAECDVHLAAIESAARRLQASYAGAVGVPPDAQVLELAKSQVLNASIRLAPLEDAFSVAIAQTSRDLAVLLYIVQTALALSLVVAAVQLSRRILARGRQVEASFRELSKRLDLATRGSSDGFWDWDLSRQLLFHSDQLRELMGWPRATGPRRAPDMWRCLHAQDVARFRRAVRLHMVGRTDSLDVEVRLRTGVAGHRWFHVRGRALQQLGRAPRSFSGAITDIHARVEAEVALRASEALLRGVFEAANDVVIVVNEHDIVQFANPAVETTFGEPVPEAIGSHVSLLQPGAPGVTPGWGFEQYTQGSGAQPRWRRMASTGRRRGGEEFPVEISFSEVFFDGRRLFAAFVRDMSPWLQVQQEVAHARQLLDSTQMRFEHVLVTELEAQQTHIAQELHDSLGSELAALSLVLGGTRATAAGTPQIAGQIDLALGQVQSAVEVTRALARGLMPVSDHPGAFWRAMERLASDFSRGRGGVSCEFATQGDVESVSSETGSHLYRIAQEALANAVRHGNSTHLEMVLSHRGHRLRLSIADDGTGFSRSSLAGENVGVGMRSMMARARAIGARIQFLRRQPSGAEVRVEWPVVQRPDGV